MSRAIDLLRRDAKSLRRAFETGKTLAGRRIADELPREFGNARVAEEAQA